MRVYHLCSAEHEVEVCKGLLTFSSWPAATSGVAIECELSKMSPFVGVI